jgi:alpha-beta hydrolase superfamily lysophospholipase
MAEHSLRYKETASCLCERSYAVWIADMRGHGRTADLGVNPKSKGGLPGHCADHRAFAKILLDIDRILLEIQQVHPGLPVFLFGHSWGSFIVQGYIEAFKRPLAGCILSGTRGPGSFLVAFGAPLMTVVAALKGVREYSAFAQRLASGAYNKAFAPNRTAFDWVSRDEREVDDLINDPLCGGHCSVGFYRDLALCLQRIYSKRALEKTPRNLPVFVFAGTCDPVGDMGAGPSALVDMYRKIGMRDIEFILYPGGRHETLHETNRGEVMGNLCDWLDRHIIKN